MKTKLKLKIPTLMQCERAFGAKAIEWVGQCMGVATAVVRAGLVAGGELRYGHYLGTVNSQSYFYKREKPRHGWIEVPKLQLIIDPTRWAFKCQPPHISVIAACQDAYHDYAVGDTGLVSTPPPPDDADPRCTGGMAVVTKIKWPRSVHVFLDSCFGRHSKLRLAQVYWLAHQSPAELGRLAKPLYTAIQSQYSAMIPIDFAQIVFKDRY